MGWGKICAMTVSDPIKANKESRERGVPSVKRTPFQRAV